MRRMAVVVSAALVAGAGFWWSRWEMTRAHAQAAPALAAPATPVVVKRTSKTPVTFDGHVSKFEYGDATYTTFPNGHGTVDVYSKCVDGMLYFAFQIPDLSPFAGDDIVIMLDTNHQRTGAPAKGDIRAYVRRKMENSRMQQGADDAPGKQGGGREVDRLLRRLGIPVGVVRDWLGGGGADSAQKPGNRGGSKNDDGPGVSHLGQRAAKGVELARGFRREQAGYVGRDDN